jgi:hypothetical protein
MSDNDDRLGVRASTSACVGGRRIIDCAVLGRGVADVFLLRGDDDLPARS